MPPRTSSDAGQPSRRFAARDRLRKRFEFRRLGNQGKRVHTRSFVLQIAPSDYEQPRLGITVSRQVGKAVRRNRIKRLLREAFRQNRALFPLASDIVVIAKGGCAVARLDDVTSELTQASGALQAARRRPPRPAREG